MDELRNIKLALEYDGSGFCGWQVQPGARTAQGELESALARLLGSRHRVVAASRTDSGAHARGQVVSFHTRSELGAGRILVALNAILPEDMVVREAGDVGVEFNARRSARSRKYTYRVVLGPSALWRRRAWSVRRPLDVPAMQTACGLVLGLRDFRAFSAGVEGNAGTLCTVMECRWRDWAEGASRGYLFEIVADRFVRYMVRTLAGTTVRIGEGRFSPDDLKAALQSGLRHRLAYTAPARGLCLEEVAY
ncbi:MAG: tRNA pseudouridine(38-40) synthase TruA [Candidatus Eisenbacteria bacterium]|nr:tRNA pseudouridine(38-40) synthase TruA [Candidatus Eisenbacteria bacterium]